jgi:hypothetical protein
MSMNRPKVWVLKEQVKQGTNGPVPIDYSPAYKFGDVQFITDFDLPARTNGTIVEQWVQKVSRCIDQMDTSRDYILLTGAPLAMFIFGLFCSMANIAPRILVWRREQGEYVVFDSLELAERHVKSIAL